MGGDTKRFDLIAVVVFFLLAIILEYQEAFSLIEDETLSYRHILRAHQWEDSLTSPSEDVVIVYTDEEFYEEYDKYPLTRVDLSTIVVRLKAMGARVIGVDMIFDFPSAYGEDPTLEDAFREAVNVLLVSAAEIEGDEYEGLNTAIDRFNNVTENGYSNISSNSVISESIVRLRIHEEMIETYDSWPFIVKAVAMYQDAEPEMVDGLLTIGEDIEVQLDQFNDMYIDYPLLPTLGDTPQRLHDVIGLSALDLLFVDDEEELEELAFLVEDKIVLIGEVAEVAHDEFETPVGDVYGVEVIADAITTILRGGSLRPASFLLELFLAVLMLAVFLGSRLIPNPFPRNAASIGAIVLYVLLVGSLYVYAGLVISMSYLLLASVLSLAVINARFYVTEIGLKGMIRDAFGQYLSPKVVSDLVKDPDKLALGGEERELTAFFSDIAGFSTISGNMSPQELVQLLNEYLTEMCNIIIGFEGTVDKFEGDLIMAFWGAPTVQRDHARLACYASIDQHKALHELREKWRSEGVPPFRVRMGLNSGPMVVGNMGSVQRMNYTVMGDAVNVAARLEGANKVYSTYSMISEATLRMCEDFIDVRELDTIRVVGKSEPVGVYELLDRKNQTSPEKANVVESFTSALDLYKAGNFADAKSGFEATLGINPDDGPSQTYVERCQLFIDSSPGADWDGVFTMTEKG